MASARPNCDGQQCKNTDPEDGNEEGADAAQRRESKAYEDEGEDEMGDTSKPYGRPFLASSAPVAAPTAGQPPPRGSSACVRREDDDDDGAHAAPPTLSRLTSSLPVLPSSPRPQKTRAPPSQTAMDSSSPADARELLHDMRQLASAVERMEATVSAVADRIIRRMDRMEQKIAAAAAAEAAKTQAMPARRGVWEKKDDAADHRNTRQRQQAWDAEKHAHHGERAASAKRSRHDR